VQLRILFSFLLASAALAAAATPQIGIIRASGHFTVEGSEVWGNSTLFDGATVETGAASSDVALRNGVRVQLGKQSRARVWENRLVLERGTGQVSAPGDFDVVAAGLDIRGEARGAKIRVGIAGGVQVAALDGKTRVSSASGLVLASIPAGRSAVFSMQAGQNASVTRTGCLLWKDNHFLQQDDNTQEVAEIQGPNLELNVGNRVTIEGTVLAARPAIPSATRVISARNVSLTEQGGCLSVASALDARTAVPAAQAGGATSAATSPASTPKATSEGLSTGAKVGIIAGVGGGAAVGVAVAVGGKSSTSP
jgi:hypothetical protein